jgi:hypothetical protein
MRRLLAAIPMLFALGCSNAPIAGTLDCFNHTSDDKRPNPPRVAAPISPPPAGPVDALPPPSGVPPLTPPT